MPDDQERIDADEEREVVGEYLSLIDGRTRPTSRFVRRPTFVLDDPVEFEWREDYGIRG